MACWDTAPYDCDYDSGGGKDYADLGVWEAVSDNDLSLYGTTILDCFDSQVHDDILNMGGATNTAEGGPYRMVRSAAGCTTPFAGKAGTGAHFTETTDSSLYTLRLNEDYSRLVELCVSWGSNLDFDGACAIELDDPHTYAIRCIAYDCANAFTGRTADGIQIEENQALAYACISYDNDGNGFWFSDGAGDTQAAIACTVGNNGAYGFFSNGTNATNIVFSCYAENNTTAEFSGNFNALSDYNCSEGDASSPGANSQDNTSISIDADYLCTATNDYGRNPYNDITATEDFDFLYNGAVGDADFEFSVEGDSRPGHTTVDATWDVGADEYIAPAGAPTRRRKSFGYIIGSHPLLLIGTFKGAQIAKKYKSMTRREFIWK